MSELMDQIAIGDRVITPDGYDEEVIGKLDALNMIVLERIENGIIKWHFIAPEECLIIASMPDDQSEDATGTRVMAPPGDFDGGSRGQDCFPPDDASCAKFEMIDGSLVCVEGMD